jgi:ribosomal protein S18 acetylase RimI-like enzyme
MKESNIEGAKDPISIRQADEKDVSLLYSVCRQSYIQSFTDHWVEGGLTWYLEKVYGMDVLERDLKNPDINYFISYYDDVPAGFMKVKLNSPLSLHVSGNHLEIEKLYFLEKYKRKGLGKRMITSVRELADKLGTDLIWLAVIDKNASAITFYENNGFRFFDKTRLEIPYFKDELRGMWRMILETGGKHHEKGTK